MKPLPYVDNGALESSILQITTAPITSLLVAAYFDLTKSFAGSDFDGVATDGGPGLLGDNPSDRFTSDDVVAASLLDVRYSPRAVRTILASGDVQRALDSIPAKVPLWKATNEDLEPARAVWKLLSGNGVGPTRVSKLLSRKRPHLIPITDARIRETLPLGDTWWANLRTALQDESIRKSIEATRPTGLTEMVSTLRLLDVSIWMTASNAKAVKLERDRANLTLAGATAFGR